jgi:uncharacterized protein (TIGR00251 family)
MIQGCEIDVRRERTVFAGGFGHRCVLLYGANRGSLRARRSYRDDSCVFRVTVRVKPGASRTAVGGRWGDSAQGEQLVVAVNAPPVDGAANMAVITAVAKEFGLRRGDIRLISGATGRSKVLELNGDSETLRRRLLELLQK